MFSYAGLSTVRLRERFEINMYSVKSYGDLPDMTVFQLSTFFKLFFYILNFTGLYLFYWVLYMTLN